MIFKDYQKIYIKIIFYNNNLWKKKKKDYLNQNSLIYK